MDAILNPPARRSLSPALLAAGALYVALAVPPVRYGLESTLIGHMMVQIPFLAVCGALVGSKFSHRIGPYAIPLLLVAVFASTFWMIPRWLDAAISDPVWELAKFLTIPALVGAPLGASWSRLSSVARGFVWANGISMIWFLGWLYVAAPQRICNNYLLNQQVDFGYTAYVVGVALVLYWVGRCLFGDWRHEGNISNVP